MVKIWVEIGVIGFGCNECIGFYGIGIRSFLVYLNLYKFILYFLLDLYFYGEVFSVLLFSFYLIWLLIFIFGRRRRFFCGEGFFYSLGIYIV